MSNPKWPQDPNFPPPPGAQQGGAPQQGPTGYAATQAMEFQPGSLPGVPLGQPPQQPQFGQPSQPQFGQPSQPQFGQGPFGQQPSQPQFGQPQFGQQPQQPQFGQQPQQPQFGQGAFGQPPQQPQFGQPQFGQQPPQQPQFGQPSPYGNPSPYGQQPQFAQAYPAPPARPAPVGGRSIAGVLGMVVLVAAGVGVRIAARSGARRATSAAFSSSSNAASRLNPLGMGNLPNTRAAHAALLPDEQLQEKLDPYVEHCLNRFSRQVFDAENRYFDWVDRRKGPTGRERNVYGIYDVNGQPSECSNAVVQASALTPRVPGLEGAGVRFAGALAVVVPLIRQAHAYYASPASYRGDGLAQGRLLHPQLVAAFEGFSAAQRALSDEIATNQDQATESLLARIRNDPTRVVEYHVKNDQRMARHLVRMIRTWDVDRRGSLTGVPTEQFVPEAQMYEQGLASLRLALVQHPVSLNRVAGVARYQSQSASYLGHVQLLARRLQTGERYTRLDMRLMAMRLGHTVQGSPEAMNRAYNDLVRAFNSMD